MITHLINELPNNQVFIIIVITSMCVNNVIMDFLNKLISDQKNSQVSSIRNCADYFNNPKSPEV